MTVELGADFRIAHCAPISLGPTRCSPSRLLPPAVSFSVTTDLPPSGTVHQFHSGPLAIHPRVFLRRFLHRRYRPAAQREKIPAPTAHRLSKWAAQWKLLNGRVGN